MRLVGAATGSALVEGADVTTRQKKEQARRMGSLLRCPRNRACKTSNLTFAPLMGRPRGIEKGLRACQKPMEKNL